MQTLRALPALAVALALSHPARADDATAQPHSSPRFSDRFFRGTTPGELPTAKVLVVGGLYAISLASVVLGVATLFEAGELEEDAEAYKLSREAGFCDNLADTRCATYRNFLRREDEARATGILLLGAGGFAALGGALTAELWPNDARRPRVALELRPGGTVICAQTKF